MQNHLALTLYYVKDNWKSLWLSRKV